MLISRSEFDNLTELLKEEFDIWTNEGYAKKYRKECKNNYSAMHEELDRFCENIIREIAQELNLEFEE